jgi:D-alanyl-D-alanine carboxypeptidase
MRFLDNFRYGRRIRQLHAELGIPPGYGRARSLPLQAEAAEVEPVGPDLFGRDQLMIPPAARAWRAMVAAAADDGVELQLVSAYRSVNYQAGLLRRKLEQGQSIGQILSVSAAPGYSEHHSGRAVDLTAPGCGVLEEDFETTGAFDWLCRRASEFGFHLSYPRDNPHGVVYEPWHWAWRDDGL